MNQFEINTLGGAMRVGFWVALLMLSAVCLGLSVAPVSADEPAFPDLSLYVPLNPADYEIQPSAKGVIFAPTVYFSASNNVQCRFERPLFAV
ncbi:hypothetical protein [Mycolicibacter minnesotensis]